MTGLPAMVELHAYAVAWEIRHTTQRPEIRAQTTEALAASIRQESFRLFLEVLDSPAEAGAVGAGRRLAAGALRGALVGGAMQTMWSGRGRTGMAVGGVMGALDSAEQMLRRLIAKAKAMEAAVTVLLDVLDRVCLAIYDQYVTYVLGAALNLDRVQQANDALTPLIVNMQQAWLAMVQHAELNSQLTELREKWFSGDEQKQCQDSLAASRNSLRQALAALDVQERRWLPPGKADA